MIVAHKAPGCIRLPSSALSVSRRPSKGAFKVNLSIACSATATPASALSIKERVVLNAALAAAMRASAVRILASAAATRVSEAKPPFDSFSAALRLISASCCLACASVRFA